MPTQAWVLIYLAELLFGIWVLRYGGASCLRGSFFGSLLIDWWAPSWTEDEFKFLASAWLVLRTVWFVLGLIWPDFRAL